jgi:hypothetical protein
MTISIRNSIYTAIALTAIFTSNVQAGTTSLIQATKVRDFSFDAFNQTLYISGTDSLQRYNVATKQFLTPIYLGGQTAGMDISADGRYLAVANNTYSDTQNYVDILDIHNGTSQRLAFTRSDYEAGTYTAAFDNKNGLLITSSSYSSAWVPLRRYDLGSEQTSVINNFIRYNSMLTPSADHGVIGIVESDISSGPWGLYQSGDASYSALGGTGGWFTYEIGVSRDATQVAVPTYKGTFIFDGTTQTALVGEYTNLHPVGVAYNPISDIVYFPWAGTSYVYAYDTTTNTRIEGFDFEEPFYSLGNFAFGIGRAKVSSDGRYLFVSTEDGVRFMSLSVVPEPGNIEMLMVGLGLIGFIQGRKKKIL